MNRSILGVGRALMARVDALSTAVASTSSDPKVQAALQASVATAQQTAQTAQSAASIAQQAAAQALTNTATLADTVAALNKLSQDYLAAVQASQTDRADLRRLIVALQTQVAALQARKVVIARGQLTVPVLALGATADVVVTLTRTMPDTGYAFELLMPASLLGKVTTTEKARTTTTVTVTCKATLAISASGLIDVTAYQLTPLT